VANALAIIAIVISIAAAGVSVWTALLNRRSAEAAEDAAESSRLSADAAEESATYAGQVAQVELNRDHEMYRLIKPADSVWHPVKDTAGQGYNLFLTFTVPRSYRLGGVRHNKDGGTTALDIRSGSFANSGQHVRVFVDDLPPERHGQPNVTSLTLWIWPPADADSGESWTCSCGKPVTEGGEPHWVWNLDVPRQGWPDPERLPVR